MNTLLDPYLIPGTNTLRNKAHITDPVKLSLFESEYVTLRYSQLTEFTLPALGTLQQLQYIHHYLFQDVYDWAGKIRTIDMSKGNGTIFQPLRFFDMGVSYAERSLQDDHMLQNLNHNDFIRKLSKNYDNFNTLHPFREGNGRAQRVFWSLIARDAGWMLDWSQTTKAENDYASYIAHESVDYSLLQAMFKTITTPLTSISMLRTLPIIRNESNQENMSKSNTYIILTEQEYQQEFQRLSYQRKTSR